MVGWWGGLGEWGLHSHLHCGRAGGSVNQNINFHKKCWVIAHSGGYQLISGEIITTLKKKILAQKLTELEIFFVNLSNFQW